MEDDEGMISNSTSVRKRQKLSNRKNEYQNEEEKSELFDFDVDYKRQNTALMSQIDRLKQKIEHLNEISSLKKENDKKLQHQIKNLKEENVTLRMQLTQIDIDTTNIDVLDEEELNELELKLQDKYQSNLQVIREARELLMDNKLRCSVCLTNQKNIVIQGCNHLELCDECEGQLERKICPRCDKIFKDVIKLNM